MAEDTDTAKITYRVICYRLLILCAHLHCCHRDRESVGGQVPPPHTSALSPVKQHIVPHHTLRQYLYSTKHVI